MIVKDMPDAAYHGRSELSSTEARLILQDGGPARYRWAKDNPPLVEPSDRFDVGKAAHALVLGVGAEVVVLDFADYRSKAAQEARDEARAEDKAPLLRHQYVEVRAMADAVLAHPTAKAILEQPGSPEASVFATDPDTGVACRARFDYLPEQGERRMVAADLKTTVSASVREFERSVASYQYETQRAWYLDCLAWETGPMPVDLLPELVFIAVEKTPPYLVAVHQLSAQWARMGVEKAKRAREIYAECAASGQWPGMPAEIQVLTAPTWAVYQHEEQYS